MLSGARLLAEQLGTTLCFPGLLRHMMADYSLAQIDPACSAMHSVRAGLPDEDVIFVRFQNEGRFRGCIPYFIAVDKSTKSVVLAIRGTLSLEDCLTDLLCEPAELDAWLKQAHGPGPSRSFSGASPPLSPVGEDLSPGLMNPGCVDEA